MSQEQFVKQSLSCYGVARSHLARRGSGRGLLLRAEGVVGVLVEAPAAAPDHQGVPLGHGDLLGGHALRRRPEGDLALADRLLEVLGRHVLLLLVVGRLLRRLQVEDVLLHQLEGARPLLQLVAQRVGQFRSLELFWRYKS